LSDIDMNESAQSNLTVYAPASIGNLSVGFDALGLALAPIDGTLLGDMVTVESGPLPDWAPEVKGPFAADLPPDPEHNIVTSCCRRFQQAAREKNITVLPLRMILDKRLPVGSGLGSSASSVVATLEALNRFHHHPLSTSELFRLMAEMEGNISGEIHLDNIAPCTFGGLRLCPPGSPTDYALPWPGAWRAVVCWPGSELVTREARSVVPDQISRGTAVLHGAQFAKFVHALHTGNTTLAAGCLTDLIAEPYRRKLLPGYDEAQMALQDLGALAVGISGSGPTIFAIVDDFEIANAVEVWMANNYRQNDNGFVHICRADLGGARSISRNLEEAPCD
jgi:homoserine kinase